ncbi:MAG: phosphonopyruvate decarboxylase [Gammaproteobacteria bacterium]|jgi:phosphonopyruvate decarboxylase|nr:phosphonopyruvate decarboxylase [Gammaproteobacteria bacterium]
MINADSFIEAARQHNFQHYTGVPCSFLTPFINYVINDDSLNYISSANEGDALATAAGLAIAGKPAVVMMQNSGLGNAVSPLTSLAYLFRIPLLIITTHRGAPGLKDEPQHELMGQITGDLFETMQTPWEYFPDEVDAIQPALQRACAHMQKEKRPYAFIMRKGTVAGHALKNNSVPSVKNREVKKQLFVNDEKTLCSRESALQRIINHTPVKNSVVIATTGFSGRELFAIDDRHNHLYMVGSMGCASSLGLGVALARPDLVTVVIDGDGAALMRMGNFATLGTYGHSKLIHILLDNEVHDSTGAQATVAGNINFAEIAAACGYGVSYKGSDVDLIDALFKTESASGPRFGHLKIRPGTIENLPRPDISPEEVLSRLMLNINSVFQ